MFRSFWIKICEALISPALVSPDEAVLQDVSRLTSIFAVSVLSFSMYVYIHESRGMLVSRKGISEEKSEHCISLKPFKGFEQKRFQSLEARLPS